MRIALVTISTSGARGERHDASGDAVAVWSAARGYELARRELIADDAAAISALLTRLCDESVADLVLTTGGTGLSPTDVTPEATRAVLEREAPGISEWLRASAVTRFPRAALSRGVSGTRKRTLIVNLPGSPGGVRDSLAALDPIVDHAVAVLVGRVTEHPEPDAG